MEERGEGVSAHRVERKDFTESYQSFTCKEGLYAWVQVGKTDSVRLDFNQSRGMSLVVKRQDIIDLADALRREYVVRTERRGDDPLMASE